MLCKLIAKIVKPIKTLIFLLPILTLQVLARFWYSYRTKEFEKWPPGLFPFPVFGNTVCLSRKPLSRLLKLKARFGSIASIFLGSQPAIVVSHYELINTFLFKIESSGKPNLPGYTMGKGRTRRGRRTGIFCTEGDDFIQHRRFLTYVLLHLGGDQRDNDFRLEIQELIQFLMIQQHFAIKSMNLFRFSVSNVLWNLISGTRFEKNDPEFRDLLECVSRYVYKWGHTSPFFFFPWIFPYFQNYTGLDAYQNDFDEIVNFMRRKVKHFKNLLGKSCDINTGTKSCLLECFFKKFRMKDPDTPVYHGKLGKANLVATMTDLFVHGTETVSATLNWAVLHLILNPSCQEEMFEEIKFVLKGAAPTMADMDRMPYTAAVISEVLRLSCVVPLAPAHRITEDVEFHGYIFPKDTLLIPNLHAAHMDREYWGPDVNKFNPNRFITTVPIPPGQNRSPNSKRRPTRSYRMHEGFIAFSFGRRACIGEILAGEEIFLFLTSLVQAFKFKPDPQQPREKLLSCLNAEESIFVRAPKPFQFRIEVRSPSPTRTPTTITRPD